MKFEVEFEKTFTLHVQVDAEDKSDAVDKARKELDLMMTPLDSAQEGYWEEVDVECLEDAE